MSVITQWGYSALVEAAREGETEVVVELVKAGANVDMQDNVCQYIYMVQSVHIHVHVALYVPHVRVYTYVRE